ncbi:hypothetical protein F5884DRAFT_678776 [Xylogone sp. PMI_703]|nr:hypothetical protein F5884DRAFT_678776 [Xylogone sp. PMI_703]
MPRPKVTDEDRRRILKACIFCQTTKQKCDGLTPCAQCRRRGRSITCAYSAHERSYGRRRRRRKDTDTLESAVPLAHISSKKPEPDPLRPDNRDEQLGCTVTKVAIPRLPHHIYDTKGRVLYMGHCAALSFLQHIQQLIESENELTTIATDMGSIPVYEELPPLRNEDMMICNTANVQELEELAEVYFISTSGIIDIFGRSFLKGLLNSWAKGTLDTNSGGAAVLYLSIALGAQVRSATEVDIQRAQTFYHHGRQIALQELTNEPSIETTQAFTLISLFMLGCSRRNGAFLNLGIAISAAKSLGLHHRETNAEFPDDESRLSMNGIHFIAYRKRIWRTIRYHDLFFCAMMGRTSSIITTDSSLEDLPELSRWTCPDFCQELGLLESARAFSFMEETVNHVYTKQSIPLGSLQRISQELKEASSKVPVELRTVSVAGSSPHSPRISRSNIIRNACVACNYYFSMMLLTRPFHITCLRAKYSYSRLEGNSSETNVYSDIVHGAMTSIDSAVKTIQLLHELMVAEILFNNMPLAVAWTFVASLTVCSAYFGRLGALKECEHAIQQADEVLQHFSKNSPQARRYSMILKKLSKTAIDHVKRLESKEHASRNNLMPELFRLNPAPSTSTHPNDNNQILIDAGNFGINTNSDMDLSYASQSYPIQETPVCETSAVAASASDSTPLLEIAHTFNDLNTIPLEMDMEQVNTGNIDMGPDFMDNHLFGLENMESIWDVNWGGGYL